MVALGGTIFSGPKHPGAIQEKVPGQTRRRCETERHGLDSSGFRKDPRCYRGHPKAAKHCVAHQPGRQPYAREKLRQGELDAPGGGDGRDQKPGDLARATGITGGEHPAPIEQKADGHGDATGEQLGGPDSFQGNREDPGQGHEHDVVGKRVDGSARRETTDLQVPEAAQRLGPSKRGEGGAGPHNL